MPLTNDDGERFMEHVALPDPANSGCWIWRGSVAGGTGYGIARFRGKAMMGAHRLAFMLAYPNIVLDGMDVCHHCDNRLCVRPDHLFVGTRRLNLLDMDLKGRRNPARGERNARARLTAQDVLAIREAYVRGDVKQSVLAQRYGITPMTVSNIVCRASWRHL